MLCDTLSKCNNDTDPLCPSVFILCIGDTVFVSGAASTPIDLVNAMTEHGKANKLSKVTVCHMHTEGKAPYTDPECEGEYYCTCLSVWWVNLLNLLFINKCLN